MTAVGTEHLLSALAAKPVAADKAQSAPSAGTGSFDNHLTQAELHRADARPTTTPQQRATNPAPPDDPPEQAARDEADSSPNDGSADEAQQQTGVESTHQVRKKPDDETDDDRQPDDQVEIREEAIIAATLPDGVDQSAGTEQAAAAGPDAVDNAVDNAVPEMPEGTAEKTAAANVVQNVQDTAKDVAKESTVRGGDNVEPRKTDASKHPAPGAGLEAAAADDPGPRGGASELDQADGAPNVPVRQHPTTSKHSRKDRRQDDAAAPAARHGADTDAAGAVASPEESETPIEPLHEATPDPAGVAAKHAKTPSVAPTGARETPGVRVPMTGNGTPGATTAAGRVARGHQAVQPPESTPATNGRDAVTNVRFVQRVARAFLVGPLAAGREVRLRLHPPELGQLRLQVRLEHGQLTAHMETETDAARTLLLNHLPALRDRLAQHEIKIDRFDVDLMQQPAGGSSDHSAADARPDRSHHGRGAPRERIAAAERPAAVGALRPVGNGQLDVVI